MMMKPGRINVLVASVLVGVAGWSAVGITAAQAEPPKQDGKQEEHAGQALLILPNGNIQYGTVISETATSVKFKGSTAGIEFTTDYPKGDILEIKRASKAGETAPAAATGSAPAVDIRPTPKPAAT